LEEALHSEIRQVAEGMISLNLCPTAISHQILTSVTIIAAGAA